MERESGQQEDLAKKQDISEKRTSLGLAPNDGYDEIIAAMEYNKMRKEVGAKDVFEGLHDYETKKHLEPYAHKRKMTPK